MSAFRHSQIQFVAEIILHQFPAVVIFQLEIGLRKALAASDPSEQGQLIVNGQVALQQRQPRMVWRKIPDANKAAFGIRHMIVRRKGIGGQIDLSTVILLQKTQNPSRVVIMTVGEDQSIHLRQGNPQLSGIVRKASAGARKAVTRKGRGAGSGNGKTAGFGHKGQKARSGVKKAGFEGGQMPLQRRLPKRGFNNIFATKYVTIKVSDLEKFEAGATVDTEALLKAGIISKTLDGVKVLGNGELTKALNVKVAAYTASAKEKIEKAGGKAEVM